MLVLVAYGSKQGGTRGLAEWLGTSLEKSGHEVAVKPAGEVDDITDYDAVVVGGALYTFRWHSDARRFVRRFADALEAKPVWLFSSGPLDDSATRSEIPPVGSARRAMQAIGARGHATFGGRILPDTKGRLPVGDWRDHDHVERFAKEIAAQLAGISDPGRELTV